MNRRAFIKRNGLWLVFVLLFMARLSVAQVMLSARHISSPVSTPTGHIVFPDGEQFAEGFLASAGSTAGGKNGLSTTSITNYCVDSTSGAYGTFGTNLTTTIFEAEVSQESSYISSTNAHSGICIRFVDVNNFASMAVFSTSAGVFQHIDRIAGVEHYAAATGLSLSAGTHYVIQVINSSGDAYTCNLLSQDKSTTIATLSGTHFTGVPASGYQASHSYASVMKIYSAKVQTGAGVTQVNSGALHMIAPLQSAEAGGVIGSSGNVTVYSDGSFKTQNNWRDVILPYSYQNFTLTGIVNRASGRAFGFGFRLTDGGDGYHVIYDQSLSAYRLWKGKMSSPTAISTSGAVTLTLGTDYPFTLTVNGTSISFTCNSVTLSVTDSTYTGAGWVGLAGFQSQGLFKSLVLK